MSNSRPVQNTAVEAEAAEEPLLRLEDFLPHRLNVLSSLVSQALTRVYGRYGIGIPEWRVLVSLGQFGVMTGKEIGSRTHMHKTKVSRAVAQLEGAQIRHPKGQPGRPARGLPVADAGRPRGLRGTGPAGARFRRQAVRGGEPSPTAPPSTGQWHSSPSARPRSWRKLKQAQSKRLNIGPGPATNGCSFVRRLQGPRP